MAKSTFGKLTKQQLAFWVSLVPLAICVVYSVLYLAGSLGYSLIIFSSRDVVAQTTILSPSLDFAVWGVALFIILARLGYDLELNVVKGYFYAFAGTILIVAVCSMAVGVVAAILGLISALALVLISMILCCLFVLFSSDFFGVKRLQFCLRLLVCAIIVLMIVELAALLV